MRPRELSEADDDLWSKMISGTDIGSVMSSGWNEDLLIAGRDGRYFAFSIEEVSTAEGAE